MERSRDHDKIATALAEARPAPQDAFAEELDRRVAAGFPRRSPRDGSPRATIAAWARTLSPGRLLFSGATAALAAIAVATIVVAGGGSSSERTQAALDRPVSPEANRVDRFAKAGGVRYSEVTPQLSHSSASNASGESAVVKPAEIEEFSRNAGYDRVGGQSLHLQSRAIRHREIERSAEIALLAAAADVADDSSKVFAAVHDANGIVLHSSTSSGKNGGARFELLIPSARLGDALAAFSSIDEVSSRHEATDDITKPTVTVSEELQDSQARVDSLLAQLSGAEVESEREAIAAQLHAERGHAARLRNQLAKLHQRTAYSRVLVRIQSGASTDSGGAWGIGNAFGDAGRILGIAAGVTLVGLAVIAPLALLCLLAWLAQRLWLRTRRERALDA